MTAGYGGIDHHAHRVPAKLALGAEVTNPWHTAHSAWTLVAPGGRTETFTSPQGSALVGVPVLGWSNTIGVQELDAAGQATVTAITNWIDIAADMVVIESPSMPLGLAKRA
jgi:hypothetical protein